MEKLYWILLVVLLVSWGSNYTVLKVALSFSSPLVLATLRAFIGTIGTMPLALYAYRTSKQKPSLPKGSKILGVTILFAILQSVIFFGCWFTAEVAVDPSTVAVLIYTNPLFVVLFTALFLSHSITQPKVLGIVIGFVGASFVVTKGDLLGLSGDAYDIALLVVAAMSIAASMVLYKRYLSNYNYYLVNFFQLAISSALLFIWAAITNIQGFFAKSLSNYSFIIALSYLVVFGPVVTNVIWFSLLDKRGPAWFASWSLLVPIFAVAIAFVALGVELVPVQLVGVVLVLAGLYEANK